MFLDDLNIAPLAVVDSVPALLSAAEMLNDVSELEGISDSFITYADQLCQDYFANHPPNDEQLESYKQLRDASTIAGTASNEELENFGDRIMAEAEDSTLPDEMLRLAYLSYASTSIHGPISDRINKKLKRIENKMNRSNANDNKNSQSNESKNKPTPSEIKNQRNKVYERCEDLLKLAKLAFKNGSLTVAYASISAMIQEIDNRQ